VSWYLGLDLSATGIAAALLHRQTWTVYPLLWPAGELAIAPEDQPPVPWAWQHRGLKQGIPGDGYRSPQLRYAQDHWVSLSTLRQQLIQQFLRIPMMQATAALPLPLSSILQDLRGIVLAMAGEGSDCYCFNLREAVLAANLVQSPDQIFFVEAAIAAWLGGQPDPTALPRSSNRPSPTLVIHTNPASTELGLVALPPDLETMDTVQRHLLSFAYGDMAMAQDILGQMFYGTLSHPDLGVAALPLPGQAEVVIRDRWQQSLQSTPLGRDLWQMATALRSAFNEPCALDFHMNGETRTIRPEDFHQAVLEPYLRQVNAAVNRVMEQAGQTPSQIQQVICSGEIANQWAIAHWFQQKFPSAKLMGLTAQPTSLAAGLARLPLYPHLFNPQPHQYSNLFLTKEILATVPQTPLSLADILKALEQRGINTAACRRAILRLLEGNLPAGLVSAPEDRALITGGGEAGDAPWFMKVESQYQVNQAVGDRLQGHLAALLTQTRQTLADPLTLAYLQG
jgi:hypothetical protein